MFSRKTSWIVILAFIVIGFGVSTCAHANDVEMVYRLISNYK